MNTIEAVNSVNLLLNQIDKDTELIPYDNVDKFIKMLEFIKGANLKTEEINIAKKILKSVKY